MKRKEHWEHAYSARRSEDLSWYQEIPARSLAMIHRAGIGLDQAVIDVGGGTSLLVDQLLNEGYQDLTVLDISATALNQSRQRLGARAALVQWLELDIVNFSAPRPYLLWHDRAVFHFLTQVKDRAHYVQAMLGALPVGGQALIATFAVGGPEKCSGLEIVQYSAASLSQELGDGFQLLEQAQERHSTPAGGSQLFGYYRFIRE